MSQPPKYIVQSPRELLGRVHERFELNGFISKIDQAKEADTAVRRFKEKFKVFRFDESLEAHQMLLAREALKLTCGITLRDQVLPFLTELSKNQDRWDELQAGINGQLQAPSDVTVREDRDPAEFFDPLAWEPSKLMRTEHPGDELVRLALTCQAMLLQEQGIHDAGVRILAAAEVLAADRGEARLSRFTIQPSSAGPSSSGESPGLPDKRPSKSKVRRSESVDTPAREQKASRNSAARKRASKNQGAG